MLFWHLLCVVGRSDCAKLQIVFPYRNWLRKLFLRYCEKLSLNIIARFFTITMKLCNYSVKIQMVLIVFWDLAQLFKADLIHTFQLSQLSYRGKFLDLYLKSVFKKILFVKSLVFWKKNENQIENKFWTFVWPCYTWNKWNMENAIFFLITT